MYIYSICIYYSIFSQFSLRFVRGFCLPKMRTVCARKITVKIYEFIGSMRNPSGESMLYRNHGNPLYYMSKK